MSRKDQQEVKDEEERNPGTSSPTKILRSLRLKRWNSGHSSLCVLCVLCGWFLFRIFRLCEVAPCEHLLQIYQDDIVFLDCLEGFVASGLEGGDGYGLSTTSLHR